MFDKFILILKSIGRKWFLLLILLIVIIFLFNPEIAIWMIIITLVIYLVSFIPNLFFSNKFNRYIKKFHSLEDKALAKKFNKPLKLIQEKLFDLFQNQEKKNWVIIYLNKQYIFYNRESVEKFMELYNSGFGEKEILENLQEYGIKTRAEVKAISDILIKFNKLKDREVSVKTYRNEQRFK